MFGLFSSKSDFGSDHRQIVLKTPLGDDSLLVESLSTHEAMSELFAVSMTLVSSDLAIDAEKLVGQNCTVTIRNPDTDSSALASSSSKSTRYFNGFVSQFFSGAVIDPTNRIEQNGRLYQIVLVPWLWFLTRSSNCRVFQEMTVTDILKEVFEDHSYRSNKHFKLSVSGSQAKRKLDYCVQFRESDFSFVSRLIERMGIYYYFEHEKSGHKMVITDKKVSGIATELSYAPMGDSENKSGCITDWTRSLEFRTGTYTLDDFDFRNSANALQATAKSNLGKLKSKTQKLEVYSWPGLYIESKNKHGTKADGKAFAQICIESEDAHREVITGSSNCKELQPGKKIKVSCAAVKAEDNKSYLITSVDHEYEQSVEMMQGGGTDIQYSNSFTCIPDSVLFSPLHATPMPKIEGPQTALVIGKKAFDNKSKSDQEILTDKYGRVKVQFHWDRREGKKQKALENSSCWIRVAQSQAGSGWGSINIPRKGEEVIVSFLDGDPDQPIITGRVYNAQNMPPYKLPENKTITTFKSRSSLKGDVDKNFNELRFEDKKGTEEIYFHAEKDFSRVVQDRDVLIVGGKKSDLESAKAITKAISKLQGDKKNAGSQAIQIFNNRSVTIQTGEEKFTVEKGDRTVTIKKGDDTHLVVEGKRVVTISKGDDILDVKKGNQTVTVDKGEHKLTVAKDITLTSSKNVDVEAKNSKITLKVGQSSITMQKDGTIDIKGKAITVNGMNLSLKASQNITLKAMQNVVMKATQNLDMKATMKASLSGALGVKVDGLNADIKGNVKAGLEGLTVGLKGGVMAQIKAPIAKIKGAINFIG